MIQFLNTYIVYIRWGVILGGLAASFWAGHHWASLSCDVEKLKVTQAALNNTVKTIEKVRYVQIKTASMPAGAASSKLFADWHRQ